MDKIKICLAPMAGVADSAMRIVCKEHGADGVTTEMVSSAAVFYKDKKTYELARIKPGEGPCAVQIFGHDPDIMAYAAGALYDAAEIKPSAFDINMGCPVKKVVSGGDGSALLKDPLLIERIVSAVRRASPVPVTVKLRIGYDKNNINIADTAKAAESGGASGVCVHGRTREDMYLQGTVKPEFIKAAVDAVKIPVTANGDIFTPEDAARMLEYTGADSIAIGRGALGDPFIFSRIKAYLSGEEFKEPDVFERIECAKKHLKLMIELKGEHTGVLEARKQVAWYTKGMRSAAEARRRVNTAQSEAGIIKILDDIAEGSK